MASNAMMEGPSSVGFDFTHHARNQFLGARLNGLPKGQSALIGVAWTQS